MNDPATRHAATVLVVEDEWLVGDMVSEALHDRGFDVHLVSNAADALEILSGLAIDVLFTDITIAGELDGSMLALRARELRPDLPIVFASARTGLFEHLGSMPGAACLAKPYSPEQVCAAVESLFATRH